MRLVVTLVVAFAAQAAHAASGPQVRVEIETSPPIRVGQQVRVGVTVLAPNFFLSAPQFPDLDVPGGLVRLLDERAINTTESIDGEPYAGIRKTYAITPQQPGVLALPPTTIAFQYAAVPGQPGTDGSVTLPATRLTVEGTPGATAGTPATPVAKVVLTQSLDRDLVGLAVGGTLTRTIDAFAANAEPMMIPPSRFDAPPGVRVYAHDPVLSDTVDANGTNGGHRVDSATYLFERAGTYTLPAIEIAWTDPATGAREISRAPAISVAVAPASWRDRIGLRGGFALAGIAALAIASALLARRDGPALRRRLANRRRAREASETARFARLAHACDANDPVAARRALREWRGSGADLDDASLRAEIASLDRFLFGPAPPSAGWRGRSLREACERARRAHARASDDPWVAALPALNP